MYCKYLFNVSDIPDVDAVIVVDDGDFEVLFVVGDRSGVGVAGVRRVRRHVTDGQPLGNVDSENKTFSVFLYRFLK